MLVPLGWAEGGTAFSAGAPAGFAGNRTASGKPATCTTCHGTYALNEGPGGVAVEAPAQAAPGETVQITVTVDNPAGGGRQGFEATVADPATGDPVGTLGVGGTGSVRFAQGDPAYVTHTDPAQTSWTFTWTAPPAAPARVRVYVAGNAADGNGGTSGDRIFTATADLALAATSLGSAPEADAFSLGAPRPNPTYGPAVLDLHLPTPGRVVVRVVDGVGRTVRHVATGDWGAGGHAVRVPTEGLAPGTYFVVADGPGGRRAQPLVVVR